MQVGVATVDFTPCCGLPLMGNFRDDYAARGVHDPLLAKAVVFAGPRGRPAALLALDLCMVDAENVAMVREEISRTSGVPPERVLVHATHTHSGPAPNGKYSFGVDMAPYRADVEAMLRKAASAVRLAERDLADAELSLGTVHEDRLSFNRRLRRRDGTTQMNWEALLPGFDPGEIEGAWGTTDPQVACLVIERAGAAPAPPVGGGVALAPPVGATRPVATIVNFGLHPAILAGDNWLYSADYPGYTAEALGRIFGPEFVSVFLNGCCGNVNHVDYRDPLQGRGYQMTQRVGYMLAGAAAEAIRLRQPIRGDDLEVSRRRVALDRIRISPAEEAWCRETLEQARLHPPRGQVDGLPDPYWADLRLRMLRQQDSPAETEVMVLRLGEAAVVGLPGEIFCESGLAIKARSPARHTLVAELANDAIGYVPAAEAFRQGGYEPTIGSAQYREDSAQRLVDAAVEQLRALFSG
jgi:hypothetical protein